MFQGRYEIILKDAKPEIESDIVFDDPPSKIVISKDGAVEILADSKERLYALSLVVRIAIGSTTGWIGFELRFVSEKNLATGEPVVRERHVDLKIIISSSGRVYSVGDLYPEARNTTLSIQDMDESNFMAIVEDANK